MTKYPMTYLGFDRPVLIDGQTWQLERACTNTRGDKFFLRGFDRIFVSKFPTQKEIDAAWRMYFQWVSDSGNDPLGAIALYDGLNLKLEAAAKAQGIYA